MCDCPDCNKSKTSSSSTTLSSISVTETVNEVELPKICNRFQLVEEIGRGSFGKVYIAKDLNKGRRVAIKCETEKGNHHGADRSRLIMESNIYKDLKGGPGIVDIYWTGAHNGTNVMVMDLLGLSLNDVYRDKCRSSFSKKTIIMLAIQIIRQLEHIHNCGYIHRDIKPANFAIGRGNYSSQVYTLDFGLSKKYIDVKTKQHIPFIKGKKFVGTLRYGSINAHSGNELSRRDDLESLGYMMYYFYFGTLPWYNVMIKDKKKHDQKILKLKKQHKNNLLKQALSPMKSYMKYVYALDFDETPNYKYLRSLFRDYAEKKEITLDWKFDW